MMKTHIAHPLVKLARQAVGLTRDEAAHLAGIHPRYLRRVENGDSYAKLTPAVKEKISQVLRSPVELLFPEVPDER